MVSVHVHHSFLYRLIKGAFADEPEFSGFYVHVINVEVGTDIYALVVDGKIDGCRALLKALDPVENSVGPAQHCGAFEDHRIALFDQFGSDHKFLDPTVLFGIKLYITRTAYHNQIIVLMRMHVPGTFYISYGTR